MRIGRYAPEKSNVSSFNNVKIDFPPASRRRPTLAVIRRIVSSKREKFFHEYLGLSSS